MKKNKRLEDVVCTKCGAVKEVMEEDEDGLKSFWHLMTDDFDMFIIKVMVWWIFLYFIHLIIKRFF